MTADSAAPGGPEELTADELLRRLRAPGELTAAEAAALARLDGGRDDDDDGDCDPRQEPPGPDGDLYDLDEPGGPEALEAATAAPAPGSRPAGRWMCCGPAPTWPGTPARSASAGWARCPTTS